MNTNTRGVTEYLARLSPTSDLELALTAARAGAEVVAAGLEKALDVFFEADADPVTDIDYPGSWTAPGRRTSPWDMGAGVLMVMEAKGTVTDQAGHPVSTRTPFVEASNGLTPGRFLKTFRDGFS